MGGICPVPVPVPIGVGVSVTVIVSIVTSGTLPEEVAFVDGGLEEGDGIVD